MKLQIEGQKLRIRVGEDELGHLLEGKPLQFHTQFADAFAMQIALELTEGDRALIDGKPGSWCISLPRAAVQTLAASLPSREGLSHVLEGKNESDSLTLLFDVDVRDSLKRRRSVR